MQKNAKGKVFTIKAASYIDINGLIW